MSHPHSHSHSHSQRPNTKGLTISWARRYHTFFGWIIKGSNKHVLNLAQLKEGNKVLDIGCGPGSLTIAAKSRVGQSGQVYGIDAAPEMIDLARQQAAKAGANVEFQVAVAEALPFPDATFDVVMSRLVFHHLPGDLKQQVLKEIRRVLKPGGMCLVVDFEPKGLPKFMRGRMGQHTPMSGVDVRHYVPLVEEAGFSDIEVGPTGHRLLSFVLGRV